jgi:RNA polymerase sigma-70 factor (ECF subfamily)
VNCTGMSVDELVFACAQTNAPSAWEEFIRRFNPLIARVVLRTARRWGESSQSILDDLVQETYLKLCADNCRLLRTFESRQPEGIYGYLKVITTNVTHDYFKAVRAAKRGPGDPLQDLEAARDNINPLQQSVPDHLLIERTILIQEIDQHLTSAVPPEDLPRSRLIFWLYYRSGLTARAIASLPDVGLTTKGVESLILRLTRMIRAALLKSAPRDELNERNSPIQQKGCRQQESF